MNVVSGRQQAVAFAASAAVIAAVAIAAAKYGVSLPFMTRDPSAIVEIHPMTGVLSNLGILAWCATAAVCGFAAWLLRDAGAREQMWFYTGAAGLTLYLTLDDFFLIHEDLANRVFGLDEKAVFVVLGLAVVSFLYYFRQLIWHSSFLVLAGALVFLSLSIMAEVIFEPVMWLLRDWKYLLEDGLKWMGIAAWGCYWVCTARNAVQAAYGVSVEASTDETAPAVEQPSAPDDAAADAEPEG